MSRTSIATIFILVLLAPRSFAQEKNLPRPGEVFSVGGRTAFVIEPPAAAEVGPVGLGVAGDASRGPQDVLAARLEGFVAARARRDDEHEHERRRDSGAEEHP